MVLFSYFRDPTLTLSSDTIYDKLIGATMYTEKIHKQEIEEFLEKYPANDYNLMILAAESAEKDILKLMSLLDKAQHDYFGALFPHIIYSHEVKSNGFIITPINKTVSPVVIEDISLGHIPHNLPFGCYTDYIVLADGLSHHLSHFMRSLYNEFGPGTNYLGAGGGSLSLKQAPCIISQKGLLENAAVLCPLSIQEDVSISVGHGWRPIETGLNVTKSKGHTIQEINWRPAIEVYSEVVEPITNKKISIGNFFEISQGYPFGIYRSAGDHIVRDPIRLNSDGSLYCIGEVPRGATISILSGTKEELMSAAHGVVDKSPKKNQRNQFLVDCISRSIFLNQHFKEELDVVKENANLDINNFGVLSIGEISNDLSGVPQVFNKTIVIGNF